MPDLIVEIPENRVKFFGGRGNMLLPSPEVLKEVIDTIPQGKVLALDVLRKHLAEQFEVLAVCPVTTKKSLTALAHDPKAKVPYWRVVKPKGELISYFLGGLEAQAEKLRQEGVELESKGQTLKVKKADGDSNG